ncbi:MAG: putative metal-binding motif-containing protein [Deltaproteobacteria bacterium]|nr:putative metal-binding motif-containing protein [Deltaproteobacteria bacterium]
MRTAWILVLAACSPLPRPGSADETLGFFPVENELCSRQTLFGEALSSLDARVASAFVVTQGQALGFDVSLEHAATIETTTRSFADPPRTRVVERVEAAAGSVTHVELATAELELGFYLLRVTSYAPGFSSDGLQAVIFVLPALDPNASLTDADGDCVTPRALDCDDTNPNVSAVEIEICADGLDNDCNGTIDDCAP